MGPQTTQLAFRSGRRSQSIELRLKFVHLANELGDAFQDFLRNSSVGGKLQDLRFERCDFYAGHGTRCTRRRSTRREQFVGCFWRGVLLISTETLFEPMCRDTKTIIVVLDETPQKSGLSVASIGTC